MGHEATEREGHHARGMIEIIPLKKGFDSNVAKGRSIDVHRRRLCIPFFKGYDEGLSYGLIATRDPTFRVDDLIELHHAGGKERLAPL